MCIYYLECFRKKILLYKHCSLWQDDGYPQRGFSATFKLVEWKIEG